MVSVLDSGTSVQKFGFINGVDNVNWPPYRDSKRKGNKRMPKWCFSFRKICSGLQLCVRRYS